MLFWTIQTTIISIILIFLVHHLINFFKSTLTVPKFKDLVNAPTHKYEDIFNIIKQNDTYNSYTPINNNILTKNKNNNDNSSDINLLPKYDNDSNYMKNELKDFLKKQLNNVNDKFPN